MAKPKREVRKAGDALILSGQLGNSFKLLDDLTDWDNATGEIHIVNKATRAVKRTESCTITPPSGTTLEPVQGRYAYVGAPFDFEATDAENLFEYEISVQLTGMPDPVTWPNDDTIFELEIVDQLA